MAAKEKLPRLDVHSQGRYLTTLDKQPFFWLADTAWELFHRLDREEIDYYLENRRQKGFTVIQAVALAELDGLRVPDRQGNLPFEEFDPSRPVEAYWQNIDWAIQMAAKKDMYIGLLPTWGDKVLLMWGKGPAIFNPVNARLYGQWIGERYRSFTNIIWILGGDRPPYNKGVDSRPIWQAMAEGIRAGASDPALITYHPNGGHSSSEWLHGEAWLDFNMLQSGHGGGRDVPVWEMIERDHALTPTKPTLDSEPNYEDHPVNPWPEWNPTNGYFRDHDVRKQSYRSVFAGGLGVTYGHHDVWQMADRDRPPVNNGSETMIWREALDRPAAAQMVHLRRLIESRPFFTRIPDQTLLVLIPVGKHKHPRATRDAYGRFAMVYLPVFSTFSLRTQSLQGKRLTAWWFNPRSGASDRIGEFANTGQLTFTTPFEGPDWVLVLDGAREDFPPPGMR